MFLQYGDFSKIRVEELVALTAFIGMPTTHRRKLWPSTSIFLEERKPKEESSLRNLLGGKGAGLAEMVNLGIPVPPGFTITTEVCTALL